MDTTIIIDKVSGSDNSLTFDIKGDPNVGLHKSIVNSVRRTLLSAIPTVGFRTNIDDSDIKIIKNTTSLHNEFLLNRISLIPLYIDAETYKKQYLFKLSVINSGESPIKMITAKDIEIYPLKSNVNPETIEDIKLEDYDMSNPISDKLKKSIFRPFTFKKKDEYCLITELKKTSSTIKQELELYGVPSVSYAYENSRWQAVSRASYMFKKDEALFKKILDEKKKLQKIEGSEEKKEFQKKLFIEESERYFHRDKFTEPYWYSFTIDSVHSMNSKELFLSANQIILDQLEILRDEFPKMSTKQEIKQETIMDIKSLKNNIYQISVHGYDDTMGNLLQSHISRNMIDEDSILSVCGYKKKHPLEDIIVFNIALNVGNNLHEAPETQKLFSIIQLFRDACDQLSYIFTLLKNEGESSL